MPSNPHGLNPNGPTTHVIDVAHPQGDAFPWDAAAADGVHAAWMQTDGTFARNWRESKANGVRRGPYAFFRANEDPVSQAETMLRSLGNDYDAADLHPMLDVEVMRGQTPLVLLDRAKKWIDVVTRETGRPVVWYTYPSFCVNPPDHPTAPGLGGVTRDWQADLLLWIAHYIVDPYTGKVYSLPKPITPKPWASWALWQVTGNIGATIGGVRVDRDVFWGASDEFDSMFTLERADTLPAPPVPVEVPAAVDFVRTLADGET